MSKYNLDIPSLERGVDITDEEISEIIAEADRIITENKEKPGKIAEACFKKSQCLQKQKRDRASRAPIEKALELYPAIPGAALRCSRQSPDRIHLYHHTQFPGY
ncbi:hypothetical protein FACS189493_4380 [Spirochaetia bacterium]|nr:hypothetical protein FACS189493_4380 [Spirochaetia bacterium]